VRTSERLRAAGTAGERGSHVMAEHAGLHESADQLTPLTIERHRALVSLIEELEAIDWYAQRVDASTDAQLRAILEHNRDEEREHAAMTLEWLRRNDSKWDEVLRRYLFTEAPITEVEAMAEAAAGNGAPHDRRLGDLGLGNLREEPQR
jgi:ferritin-like protein